MTEAKGSQDKEHRWHLKVKRQVNRFQVTASRRNTALYRYCYYSPGISPSTSDLYNYNIINYNFYSLHPSQQQWETNTLERLRPGTLTKTVYWYIFYKVEFGRNNDSTSKQLAYDIREYIQNDGYVRSYRSIYIVPK